MSLVAGITLFPLLPNIEGYYYNIVMICYFQKRQVLN